MGKQQGKTKMQEVINENIRKFKSGAIRDSEKDKEDLIETISWTGLRRFAQYMTGKKSKYGAGNFKKGIDIASYERSLMRHIVKYFINKEEGGNLEKNEDHLSAILFNTFGIIHEEEMAKNKNSKITEPTSKAATANDFFGE